MADNERKVTLLLKRGLKKDLPTLLEGEMGLATDTKELFIGSANGNVKIAGQESVDSVLTKVADVKVKTGKIVNVSIDDFYRALQDITVNEATYKSIFDNSIFALMKRMHDNYGVKFSCFCYTLGGGFDLKTTTSKFKDEILAQKDWISFAFHGKDDATSYNTATLADFKTEHDNFLTALDKFASREMLSKVTRLASYTGTASIVAECKNTYGYEALLAGEDSRLSYDLTAAEVNTLDMNHVYVKNGMTYIKTEYRMELSSAPNIVPFMETLKGQDRIALFTHEQSIAAIESRMSIFFDWLNKNFYEFSLFNDLGKKKDIIYTPSPEAIPFTFSTNWQVRTGQDFRVIKHGKMVTIQGQLEKINTDITEQETILTMKYGKPLQPIITSVVAFDATTIQSGVPLIIQNNGAITVGWRGVKPDAGKRYLGFTLTYMSV